MEDNFDQQPDDTELVPLEGFRSTSEMEIVAGLLRSSGIPVLVRDRYTPRMRRPAALLVPRNCLDEVNRMIGQARQPDSIPSYETPEEPRSPLTVFIWIAAIAMALYALSALIGVVRRYVR